MRAYKRKLSLAGAMLILAPALLCATSPRDASPAGPGTPAARINAKEGIHCFCHPAGEARSGVIRAPESLSASAHYLIALLDGRPDTVAGRLAPDSAPFAADQPAPEPLLPPPVPIG
ncbi:MAG: hypothetical protein Q8R92_14955 [Deltaproteobacteria bacterium]|nr:hypothetical protein [Deltaproteobacteria bacterium]